MDGSIPTQPSAGKPSPQLLTAAADSEFEGPVTVTVQTAARTDEQTITVQVYRSSLIPDLPSEFDQDKYLPITEEKYGRFCQKINILPTKPLTVYLSPAHIVRDLYALEGYEVRFRTQDWLTGGPLDPFADCVPANAVKHKRKDETIIPSIDVELWFHYQRADLLRIFGRAFLDSLRPRPFQKRDVIQLRSQKSISFAGRLGRRPIKNPILEYLVRGQELYAVRVRTRDTFFPFGPASLDSFSKTFLGLGKSHTLSEEDKKHMLRAFQTKTADAFGYAMTDAVNTLLIQEQMQAKDRKIYRAFGFPERRIPPLRPTVGSRVSTFMLRAVHEPAKDSSSEYESQAVE